MMTSQTVQAIGANGLYDFPRNARAANTIQSTHVRTEKEINVLRVTVYVGTSTPSARRDRVSSTAPRINGAKMATATVAYVKDRHG
jgi:hypothetical protein